MQPDSWKQPIDFSQILEHYLCFYCDERETRWAKVLLCKRYKLSRCYERNCIRNKKAAANRGSFVDFSIHWLDKIIPTTFLMHPRSGKKHLTLLNFIISDVMIHAGEWLTKVHSHYDRPPPHLQIYIFLQMHALGIKASPLEMLACVSRCCSSCPVNHTCLLILPRGLLKCSRFCLLTYVLTNSLSAPSRIISCLCICMLTCERMWEIIRYRNNIRERKIGSIWVRGQMSIAAFQRNSNQNKCGKTK